MGPLAIAKALKIGRASVYLGADKLAANNSPPVASKPRRHAGLERRRRSRVSIRSKLHRWARRKLNRAE
jgi:hypothetical protein